jgi:hypothetical protein
MTRKQQQGQQQLLPMKATPLLLASWLQQQV